MSDNKSNKESIFDSNKDMSSKGDLNDELKDLKKLKKKPTEIEKEAIDNFSDKENGKKLIIKRR